MSKEATQYEVDAHIPSPESLEVLAAMTYDGQYEDDGDEDGSSQSQPRLAATVSPAKHERRYDRHLQHFPLRREARRQQPC